MFATMLVVIQLVVSVVVGLYFFRQLRQSRQKEPAHGRESNREMERMRHLRSIHLSEPLAEKVRPTKMSDVIGQEDGIRSLKAILCGANPQHVLIYGAAGAGGGEAVAGDAIPRGCAVHRGGCDVRAL